MNEVHITLKYQEKPDSFSFHVFFGLQKYLWGICVCVCLVLPNIGQTGIFRRCFNKVSINTYKHENAPIICDRKYLV